MTAPYSFLQGAGGILDKIIVGDGRAQVVEPDGLFDCDRVPQLRFLFLAHSTLATVQGISALRNLWYLDISYTRVDHLLGLENVSALGLFDMRGTGLTFKTIRLSLQRIHIVNLRVADSVAAKQAPRKRIISALPRAWVLDDIFITAAETQNACEAFPSERSNAYRCISSYGMAMDAASMLQQDALVEGSGPKAQRKPRLSLLASKGEWRRMDSVAYGVAVSDFLDIVASEPTDTKLRDTFRLKHVMEMYLRDSFALREALDSQHSTAAHRPALASAAKAVHKGPGRGHATVLEDMDMEGIGSPIWIHCLPLHLDILMEEEDTVIADLLGIIACACLFPTIQLQQKAGAGPYESLPRAVVPVPKPLLFDAIVAAMARHVLSTSTIAGPATDAAPMTSRPEESSEVRPLVRGRSSNTLADAAAEATRTLTRGRSSNTLVDAAAEAVRAAGLEVTSSQAASTAKSRALLDKEDLEAIERVARDLSDLSPCAMHMWMYFAVQAARMRGFIREMPPQVNPDPDDPSPASHVTTVVDERPFMLRMLAKEDRLGLPKLRLSAMKRKYGDRLPITLQSPTSSRVLDRSPSMRNVVNQPAPSTLQLMPSTSMRVIQEGAASPLLSSPLARMPSTRSFNAGQLSPLQRQPSSRAIVAPGAAAESPTGGLYRSPSMRTMNANPLESPKGLSLRSPTLRNNVNTVSTAGQAPVPETGVPSMFRSPTFMNLLQGPPTTFNRQFSFRDGGTSRERTVSPPNAPPGPSLLSFLTSYRVLWSSLPPSGIFQHCGIQPHYVITDTYATLLRHGLLFLCLMASKAAAGSSSHVIPFPKLPLLSRLFTRFSGVTGAEIRFRLEKLEGVDHAEANDLVWDIFRDAVPALFPDNIERSVALQFKHLLISAYSEPPVPAPPVVETVSSPLASPSLHRSAPPIMLREIDENSSEEGRGEESGEEEDVESVHTAEFVTPPSPMFPPIKDRGAGVRFAGSVYSSLSRRSPVSPVDHKKRLPAPAFTSPPQEAQTPLRVAMAVHALGRVGLSPPLRHHIEKRQREIAHVRRAVHSLHRQYNAKVKEDIIARAQRAALVQTLRGQRHHTNNNSSMYQAMSTGLTESRSAPALPAVARSPGGGSGTASTTVLSPLRAAAAQEHSVAMRAASLMARMGEDGSGMYPPQQGHASTVAHAPVPMGNVSIFRDPDSLAMLLGTDGAEGDEEEGEGDAGMGATARPMLSTADPGTGSDVGMTRLPFLPADLYEDDCSDAPDSPYTYIPIHSHTSSM